MIAPLFRTWRYPAFWGLLFLAQLLWGAVSFAVAAYQNMGQNMDHITLLAAFMGMNSVSETLMAQAMLWLCLRPFSCYRNSGSIMRCAITTPLSATRVR
ncbi:hypothetical protein [Thioclava sp. GXIMD4215]|uniref:hypothetical protein n=1 Tax=Thioclava sp. GXIMD4215 TaxID=3131928 RepID=UPI00324A0BF2